MSKEEGGNRHEKAQEDTRSLLASLPSRIPLEFSRLRGYLIRQLVPFFLRHSLFDILRFQQ